MPTPIVIGNTCPENPGGHETIDEMDWDNWYDGPPLAPISSLKFKTAPCKHCGCWYLAAAEKV